MASAGAQPLHLDFLWNIAPRKGIASFHTAAQVLFFITWSKRLAIQGDAINQQSVQLRPLYLCVSAHCTASPRILFHDLASRTCLLQTSLMSISRFPSQQDLMTLKVAGKGELVFQLNTFDLRENVQRLRSLLAQHLERPFRNWKNGHNCCHKM